MRREDVRPLLQDVAEDLSEPDLADAAWTMGLSSWKRTRRLTLIAVIAIIVAALVAAVLATTNGTNTGPTPPTASPDIPGYVQPAGQIQGMDFWLAPPPGSEPYLDPIHTPLGEVLRYPDQARRLSDEPMKRAAAVVLAERNGLYEPLVLDADSSWARVDLQLQPIRSGRPLTAGAVSPDGRFVAFPQPGEVVAIDVTTAQEVRRRLPVQDIRSVSWLPDSQRILVSGPTTAYRVLVGQGGPGEQEMVAVRSHPDPAAVTAPFRLADSAVSRYLTEGRWIIDSALPLPAQSWVGQTFTAPGGTVAARVLVAETLPQVRMVASQPQVVAAITTLRTEPSRLLVLGETPARSPASTPQPPAAVREPGCCSLAGWYSERIPLILVKDWLLGWDLRTGQVHRIAELEVPAIAIGPGIRP